MEDIRQWLSSIEINNKKLTQEEIEKRATIWESNFQKNNKYGFGRVMSVLCSLIQTYHLKWVEGKEEDIFLRTKNGGYYKDYRTGVHSSCIKILHEDNTEMPLSTYRFLTKNKLKKPEIKVFFETIKQFEDFGITPKFIEHSTSWAESPYTIFSVFGVFYQVDGVIIKK